VRLAAYSVGESWQVASSRDQRKKLSIRFRSALAEPEQQ
jgi:hypothetical protein